MLRYWLFGSLGVLLWAALPCPAPSCSLCGSLQNQQTLRQQFQKADLVLYGTLARPRFNTQPDSVPGSGTTDLHILQVLKSHPRLGQQKVLTLNRYIPLLDPREPPKFLVFCDFPRGELDAYGGRPVHSAALLRYLEGSLARQGQSRVQSLLYYFQFLDHEDTDIAGDAFLEFAKATDDEVGQAAKQLPPQRLRSLLTNPKTPPERLNLLAFLLGAAGQSQDAELLLPLIDHPTDRTRNALDGLLCGYIELQPQPGWNKVMRILADSKRSFTERLAASRVLRFFHNWKPKESRTHIVRGLGIMVADGDLADLALDDLRRWQYWELTDEVLACYGKTSHAAPITQRAILRYALSCPLPQARQFRERQRRRDPDLYREVAESLEFEQRLGAEDMRSP